MKKRKIDYNQKKYNSNPLFRSKKKGRRIQWKIKVIPVVIFICIGGLVWLFYFSQYFMIKNIDVSGSGKINSEEIRAKAFDELNKKSYLVLAEKNIFLFNTGSLYKILSDQYSFDNLTIKKKYPSSIKITYLGRKYAMVWSEGSKFFYIDILGNIINEASSTDPNFKNYPLIENQADLKASDRKIKDQEKIINFAYSLYGYFNDKFKTQKVQKFILDSNQHTVSAAISTSTLIYFNSEEKLQPQTDKLETIIKGKLKNDFLKKKYIDLRFGDMVYYQ